jgi:hypothetical protein
MGQEQNAQLDAFVETTKFFIEKLRRYTTDATVEEMQWTPAGVNNSLEHTNRQHARR